MPEKAPSDHKKPDEGYTFTHKGKKFRLPPPNEHAEDVPGGVTMDAIMRPDDEMAQLRLAYAMLECAKPTPAALSALREKTTKDMLGIVGEWMGESGGSSD